MKRSLLWFSFSVCFFSYCSNLRADERLFGYSYEPDVLPKEQLEVEQWITSRIGKTGGTYSRWDFRDELEYGITDRLTTSLYLNFKDEYFSPKEKSDREALFSDDGELKTSKDELEFEGISSEWKYQILNPFIDPLGALIYGELTGGAHRIELEEKVVLGKYWHNLWVVAMNASIEQEWQFEHGDTKKEGSMEVTGGLAYKLTPQWALGVETRLHKTFDNFDLGHQLTSGWFAGPALHYGAPSWYATLTVLPQISGIGAVTRGGLELEEHERIEVRLLVGKLFGS